MMTAPEPGRIIWQKISYCAANGDCVQVAPALGRVLVRDSKDPEGPAGHPHPRLAQLPAHPHP